MQENARYPGQKLPPCAGRPHRLQLTDPTSEATEERPAGRRLRLSGPGHQHCSGLPVGGAVTATTPAWIGLSLALAVRANSQRAAPAASLPAFQVLAANRERNTGPSPLLIPGSCTAKNIGETEVYSLVIKKFVGEINSFVHIQRKGKNQNKTKYRFMYIKNCS